MKFCCFLCTIFILSLNVISAQPFAYAVNNRSNTVSVIDTATQAVVNTITVGENPFGVAISPDGTMACVGNASSNDISIINTATQTVTATIPVGSLPLGIAFSPDGSRIYVTVSFSIAVINVATASLIDTFPVTTTSAIFGIAITPDGNTAYVTVINSPGSVLPINLANQTTGTAIPVGNAPQSIKITFDGLKAYVANSDSSNVSVIDIASNAVIATIALVNAPAFLTISHDNANVYVSSGDNTLATEAAISVINTATDTVSNQINLGAGNYRGIDITPDDSMLYVVDANGTELPGTVIAYNLITGIASTPIPVGINPQSLSITPAPSPIVNQVTPNSGPSAGGTIIEITGQNFNDVTQVLFGNVPAQSFTVNSDTSITAVAPAGLGTVNVFIVANNQTSAATVVGQFTYISATNNVFPPVNLNGRQIANEFATQTEYVNVIKFDSPQNGIVPVQYNVYRDASLQVLIGVVSADHRLKFKDHLLKKGRNYTYFITSVDSSNNQSAPATITIKSKK